MTSESQSHINAKCMAITLIKASERVLYDCFFIQKLSLRNITIRTSC